MGNGAQISRLRASEGFRRAKGRRPEWTRQRRFWAAGGLGAGGPEGCRAGMPDRRRWPVALGEGDRRTRERLRPRLLDDGFDLLRGLSDGGHG